MVVREQSINFTKVAFASELVERGEHPTVSAAVSGELTRAKAARERQARLLKAEVARHWPCRPTGGRRWAN